MSKAITLPRRPATVQVISYRTIALLATTTFLSCPWSAAFALPVGGVVSGGSASIASGSSQTVVTQTSQRSVINWGSFNVGSGQTVQYVQPSSSSVTLNRVSGSAGASQIAGMITANGNVWVSNPNGMVFGKGSQVNTSGFLATTSSISDTSFMSGSNRFTPGGNPNASIVNNGSITVNQAGLAALVAPTVVNNGTISATLGKVQLASGDAYAVDLYGDGLINLQASPAITSQLVSNSGTISANGGAVTLSAAAATNVVDSLINLDGAIEAQSIGDKTGSVSIVALGGNAVAGNVAADKGLTPGGAVTVSGSIDASGYGAGSKGGSVTVTAGTVNVLSGASIDASGDAGGGGIKIGGDFHGQGATPTALTTTVQAGTRIRANAITSGKGGTVAVWSDGDTDFAGSVEARGGAHSGDGGIVETSGHSLSLSGTVNASAPQGAAGTWLLDPNNVIIDSTDATANAGSSPTFTGAAATSYVNTSDIVSALNSGTSVSVTASGSIALNSNITESAYNGTESLTLAAGTDITLANNTAITASGSSHLNVTLDADTANAGGAITLNSGASISSNGGNITLGGGATPATGYATGDAASQYGVYINSATLNAASGNITMNGQGYATTANSNYGVYLASGSTIQTSGTGTIAINGIGGGTGASNTNVGIVDHGTISSTASGGITLIGYSGDNGGSGSSYYNDGTDIYGSLSSIDGNIIIDGNTGINGRAISTTAGSTNDGVYIETDAGTISSSGHGTITINGIGVGSGASSYDYGVFLNSTTLTSTTGAIAITGTGSLNGTSSADEEYGVYVQGGGIQTTSGNITLTGTGGVAPGHFSEGIYISGIFGNSSLLTIQTQNGNILFNGTGGTGGSGEIGIEIDGGATVEATASGNVTLNGIAGNGTDGGSYPNANVGVQIMNDGFPGSADATVMVNTGNLSISGTGNGAGIYNTAILLDGQAIINSTGSGSISLSGHSPSGTPDIVIHNDYGSINSIGSSSTTGNITLAANGIDFTNLTGITTTGAVTFATYTANTAINFANGTSGLAITQAIMDLVNAPTVVVGRTDSTGTLTTGNFIWENTLSYLNLEGGSDTIGGNITKSSGTNNATLDIIAGADITVNANKAISSSGSFGQMNTVLDANYAGNGGAIVLNTGSSISSNGGNITLGGGATPSTGYAVGDAASQYGVYLNNATINAGSGGITLNGQGYAANSNSNDGVYIDSASMVSTSGAGNIIFKGLGGGAGASAGNDYGIQSVGTVQTSGTGSITMTGYGGAGVNAWGVVIQGTVQSTGSGGGSINFTGYGGDTGGTSYASGTYIGGTVTSLDGNINITGTGGSTSGSNVTPGQGDYGVFIFPQIGGIVRSTGTAAINITGHGGGTGASSGNYGVYMGASAGAQLTSVSGNVNISGNGGNTSGGSDYGIYLQNNPTVYTTGSGNITFTGIGGNGNTGIVSSASSSTNPIGGASDTGNITFNTDALSLASTPIQTSGTVTFAPYTASDSIGFSGGTGTLQVTQAIMDAVNAPTVVVGRTDSIGALKTGAFTWESTLNNLYLEGGNDTIGGNVTKASGTNNATLNVIAGTEITVNANAVISSSGSFGKINTVLDADYAGAGGEISMNSGSSISSNGGNIILGGGFNPLISDAVADSSNNNDGIYLNGVTLNAGAGAINLRGDAGTQSSAGIYAAGNNLIETTSGNIGLYSTVFQVSDSGQAYPFQYAGAITTQSGGITLIDTIPVSHVATCYNCIGILFNNATISSTGTGTVGSINITGVAPIDGANNSFSFGVSGSPAISSVDANINVNGSLTGTVNATPGTYSIGINLAGSVTSTGNGNITLTGTGGASAGNDWGLLINSQTISAHNGSITLQGTGAGTGANDYGINFIGQILSTGTAPINITAIGAAGAAAINSSAGNTIGGASDTGNITLNADSISLTSTPIQTTGTVTFAPYTASDSIGFSGGAGTLQVTQAIMDNVNAPTVIVGRTDSTAALNTGAFTWESTLNNLYLEGGSDAIGGTIIKSSGSTATLTATANGNITQSSGDNITSTSNALNIVLDSNANGSGGYIALSGNITTNGGNITLGGNSLSGGLPSGSTVGASTSGAQYGINLGSGTTLNAGGGNITMTGTGGTYASGFNYGIYSNGTIETSGAGTISLNGTGGSATNGGNFGIDLEPISTLQTFGTGNISLTGFGGGTGTSSENLGVELAGMVQSTATAGGGITVIGYGGDSGGSGNSNSGVAVDSGGYVNSVDGAIVIKGNTGINGHAVSTATGDYNTGVDVDLFSTVQSTGTAPITITGLGAGSGGSGSDYGFYMFSHYATVTSANGNISINGTGGSGTGSNNNGVVISNTDYVQSTGAASISITGTGGGSGASSNDYGALISGTIQTAAVNGGSITLTGFGGDTGGSGSYAYGVYLNGMVTSTATGGGNLTLIGYSGNNNGSGGGNQGIDITGTVSSIDGNILIDGNTGINGQTVSNTIGGTGGNGNYGIFNTGTISSTGNASITLNGEGAGSGASNSDYGVFLFTGTSITNTAGNIIISSSDNGSNFDTGIYSETFSGNNIIGGASDRGNITFNADNIDFSNTAIRSTGTVTFAPYTANDSIAFSGGTGNLQVTQATMDLVNAPTVVIGRTDSTGTLTTGNFTWESTLNNLYLEGGSDTIGGNITKASGSNNTALTVIAGTDIRVNANEAISSSTSFGQMNTVLDADYAGAGGSIVMNSGSAIASNGGNITLGGGATPATGYAVGDAMSSGIGINIGSGGGATLNAGGGNITLNGQGYAQAANGNYGIYVESGSTVETTGTGAIALIGIGGGTGTSANNYGIDAAGTVQSTASGALGITLVGYGGDNGGTGSNNIGTYIGGALSSTDGNIVISGNEGLNGQAVTTATGASNQGVYEIGTISSTGNAAITINGIGGGTGAGNYDAGIVIYQSTSPGALVTSSAGNVTLTGTGSAHSSGLNEEGIDIEGGGAQTTSGTISLNGTGGAASGDFSEGIVLSGAGSSNIPFTLQTTAGNIVLHGTGGTGTAITNNNAAEIGIDIEGGNVQTTSGNITLTGTGGTGAGEFSSGVYLSGDYNSQGLLTIHTQNGNITIAGTGGTGGSGENGVDMEGGVAVSATGSGAVSITGTAGNGADGGDLYDANIGVILENSFGAGYESLVQVNNGNLSINATGNGAGTYNDAMLLDGYGIINSTGSGSITLSGHCLTGGTDIVFNNDTGSINSIGGNSTTGNITLIADSIDASTLSGIQTAGNVLIKPYTTSTAINVATGSTGLEISSSMLSDISAGSITIGSTSDTGVMNVGSYAWGTPVTFNDGTGNINIANSSDALSFAHALNANTTTGNVTLSAATDILENGGGTITTQGGNVTFDADTAGAGGAIVLTGSSILTNGGNIVLGGGATPFTGYAVGDAADAGGITIGNGSAATINAGSGSITINGRGYAANTNYNYGIDIDSASTVQTSSGNITLNGIGGGTGVNTNHNYGLRVAGTVQAIGSGAVLLHSLSGDIVLDSGAVLSSAASGNALTLASAANFTNNVGSGALSATNGRWLVYSANPANDIDGGLSNNFVRYSCTYSGSCPSFPSTGNGLLYSTTPLLTITPEGVSTIYGSAAPSFTGYGYTVSGYLGSDSSHDTLTGSLNGSTNYTQGGNAGNYNIDYASGALASALGYGLTYADNTSGLTVGRKTITVSLTGTVDKAYDSTTTATLDQNNYILSGVINGDMVSLNNSITGTYSDPNVGNHKAVLVTGLSLSGTSSSNYALATTSISGIVGEIDGKFVYVTADNQSKFYSAVTPTLTYNYSDGGIPIRFNGSLFTPVTPISQTGTYAITQGSLTADNYIIYFVPGTFTVNPLPETIMQTPATTFTDSSYINTLASDRLFHPTSSNGGLIYLDASLVSRLGFNQHEILKWSDGVVSF